MASTVAESRPPLRRTTALVKNPRPESFQARAAQLGLDSSFLRAARGARGLPPLRHRGGGLDESVQPLERLGAVHLEAPVLLGLDDDDAGAGDARVAAAQQPLLHFLGQRGGADVEAQMHRVGDLVDVLAARALRAHRAELYLALLHVDAVHRPSVYRARPLLKIGAPPG